jgi:LemA protein
MNYEPGTKNYELKTKNTMENLLMIALISLGIILVFVIGTYNRLVSLRNMGKNAFANIDVMLKKRYDLIPNLVSAAKGYMKHEQETLERITQLRAQAMSPSATEDDKIGINNMISKAIGNIMVSVEAYPELKASENFMHLQRSMAEIEEQLSASRRSYNMAVTEYNTKLEVFPSNLIANLFSFKRKILFEATLDERKVIDAGAMFS